MVATSPGHLYTVVGVPSCNSHLSHSTGQAFWWAGGRLRREPTGIVPLLWEQGTWGAGLRE